MKGLSQEEIQKLYFNCVTWKEADIICHFFPSIQIFIKLQCLPDFQRDALSKKFLINQIANKYYFASSMFYGFLRLFSRSGETKREMLSYIKGLVKGRKSSCFFAKTKSESRYLQIIRK